MPTAQPAGRADFSTAVDARQWLVFKLGRIRGICVLAIILIHVAGSFDGRAPLDWLTAVRIFASSVSRFAVPVFVMLSGFHLSLNARNEQAFRFYRRTLRFLIIPYLVYSTLYTLVRGSLQSHHLLSGTEFISALNWNVWHASAAAHLWFIPAIVGLYLVHPFLRGWYRRGGRGGLLVIGILGVQMAFQVVNEVLSQSAEPSQWVAVGRVWLSFLPYLGYFALGYYLADHAARIVAMMERRTMKVAAAATWLILAMVISACWAIPLLRGATFNSLRYPWLPVTLLQGPLAVASFVLLATWAPQRALTADLARFADRCGLYAYGVYYIHPLVLIVVTLGWRFGLGLNAADALFYISAFPLVSVLSVQSVRSLAGLPAARHLVG
jgi:surface polysaccharide O-acyltransferase-like enzyme